MRATRETYISVDVEADGPVPGPYSLVSLGACVAAVRGADGEIEIVDPGAYTFYRELKPISDPNAGYMTRGRLAITAQDALQGTSRRRVAIEPAAAIAAA